MLAAIVVHRTETHDGASLIEQLRRQVPELPILAVASAEQRDVSFQAGASAFLHRDAWLSVGRAVEDMMRFGASRPPFAFPKDPVPLRSSGRDSAERLGPRSSNCP